MKKYPKALADVTVLKEVLDYLYRQAENAEDQVDHYAEMIQTAKEKGESYTWHEECMIEHMAKAEAYVRMAERLAK